MSFRSVPLPSIFPRIYRHREQLAVVVVVLFLNTKHWKSFDKFVEILTKQHLQKKKIFFALPNIIPLLFYSNHTTNDIFIILCYNVGIFWQIAAVTYTIGPYWILDDLIIIYYLSSSQRSILCVLPKLLSAAIIKMAWQNDCKKSSSILDIFASHLSDLKNRTRKFNGVSSSVLLRLLLPFAAASCVLTPPRSIIESPTASKIPPSRFLKSELLHFSIRHSTRQGGRAVW